MAIYYGPAKNYTITTYTKGDTALDTLMSELGMASSLISGYGSKQQFVVVKDSSACSNGWYWYRYFNKC